MIGVGCATVAATGVAQFFRLLTAVEFESCCEATMNPLRGGVGPVRRQKDAADAKKPPSRRRMVCGIDGCAYDGEYRLHARHRRLVHSGKRADYANNSFGVGGRFRSWVQKPLAVEDENIHHQRQGQGEY